MIHKKEEKYIQNELLSNQTAPTSYLLNPRVEYNLFEILYKNKKENKVIKNIINS